MNAIKFSTRSPRKVPESVDVRYDCACGCKPSARYERGSEKSGSQHCCCGIVHFAGADAKRQLMDYLSERKADGRDDRALTYKVTSAMVEAPWGEALKVVYAEPEYPSA